MDDKNITLAKRIATAIANEGGRAYYVGGYVRDQILGVENKDIDIEIHGITIDILEKILLSFGKPISMGNSFGIYQLQNANVDISLPRSGEDLYKIDPFIGIEAAAGRRDFTINALMQDILTNEVIDFFGGREDIDNRIIRQVSNHTFISNPLRVFRAAQFAARFSFSVDNKTSLSASEINLSTIASERVYSELEKALLKAEKPSAFFEELRKMNQLSVWFPELAALIDVLQNPVHHPEGNVWIHTMQVLDEAAKLREKSYHPYWFMLSALCHDYGKALTTEEQSGTLHAYGHEIEGLLLTEHFLNRLTSNFKLTQYVLNMVELHMKPNSMARNTESVKSFMKLFDQSICPEDLLLLSKADYLGRVGEETDVELQINNYKPTEAKLHDMLSRFRKEMAQPYVRGRDLVEAGIEPGALMGEALQYAHKLRIAGLPKNEQLRQTLGWIHAAERKQKRSKS